MRVRFWVPLLAIGLFLSAGLPLIAHHAFQATFDADKPIKLTGTVTKIEWQNPHTWFYMDVKEANGSTTNWGMELGSPNLLIRAIVTGSSGGRRPSLAVITRTPGAPGGGAAKARA